jgi:hypothetical protein
VLLKNHTVSIILNQKNTEDKGGNIGKVC